MITQTHYDIVRRSLVVFLLLLLKFSGDNLAGHVDSNISFDNTSGTHIFSWRLL